MARYPPVIGEWYRSFDGDIFEVVAYDPGSGTIEIQHADGALEELYLDVWDALGLIPAVQPENWLGPMDLSQEDLEQFDESAVLRRYNRNDFRNEIDGIA